MERGEALRPERPDQFSLDAVHENTDRLGAFAWPDHARFPVNRPGATVRREVWAGLVRSRRPLVAVGFASIGQLVDLLGARTSGASDRRAQLRVVLAPDPPLQQGSHPRR